MNSRPYRYHDPNGHQLWDPNLLVQLLQAHGICVKKGELSTLWSRLTTDPEAVPGALVDALCHVHALSDVSAHDQLVQALGGPLFVSDRAFMPPRDLSLYAWLKHREVFHRVYSRRAISGARRFREFSGRKSLDLVLPKSDQIDVIEKELGQSFKQRNRSAHCRIMPYELDGLTHFDIYHGRPYTRVGRLEELLNEIRESELAYRPQQVDRVSYEAQTGRLRVTARDARTLRTYCEVFGDVLFGSRTWFNNTAVLTLTPLLLDPKAALRPTAGIRSVRVVHARVRCAGRSGLELSFDSEDIFTGMSEHGGVSLKDGTLIQVHLELTFANGKARVTRLALPNRVSYNHNRDESVVRHYLEERGFLDGPLVFQLGD